MRSTQLQAKPLKGKLKEAQGGIAGMTVPGSSEAYERLFNPQWGTVPLLSSATCVVVLCFAFLASSSVPLLGLDSCLHMFFFSEESMSSNDFFFGVRFLGAMSNCFPCAHPKDTVGSVRAIGSAGVGAS